MKVSKNSFGALGLSILFLFSAIAPSSLAAESVQLSSVSPATLSAMAAAARQYRAIGVATAVTFNLATQDGDVEVRIEPHDIRAHGYIAQTLSARGVELDDAAYATDLFTGTVDTGIATDFARFALVSRADTGEKRLSGYVRANDLYYSVEATDNSNEKLSVEMVKPEQLREMAIRCGVSVSHYYQNDELQRSYEPLSATLRQAQIATEADYEYVQTLGSSGSANAEILAILNGVDGLYRSQLGVTLVVTFQNAWTTSSDPYSSTSPDTSLDEFLMYWESRFRGSVNYDLAHLWSGKDYDDSVAGLAYVSAICSSFAYGTGQYFSTRSLTVPLAAHEIGHNFGAGHDNCSNGQEYIMCPFLISDVATFSTSSISQISSVVSGSDCLTTIDDPGVPSEPSPPVLGAIGSRSVAEGSTLSFTLSATDVNGGSLAFSADSLPSGATLSGANFSYTAPYSAVSGGSWTAERIVTFTVTDSTGLSDSEAVVITIQNTNRAPEFGSSALSYDVSEGEKLEFVVAASDSDGDILAFSAPNGLPGGASLGFLDGSFSWVPSGSQSGDYSVVVQVRDVFGETDTTTITIDVSDAPGVDEGPSSHIFGDYTGEGRSQVSVYRPSTSEWYFETFGFGSARLPASTSFGLSGDVPVPADYNGDNITDVAVFRPSLSMWFVRNSGSEAMTTLSFGLDGDLPAPGDFDGDGRADFAVFRPAIGAFIYRKSSDGVSDVIASIGARGDIPVPCDYDGNGDDEVAVYRPSTGTWLVNGSGETQFGLDYDIPVPADYDGDGDCDIAVWRPITGEWYVSGSLSSIQFGLGGDVPSPQDMDGDGDADLVVYRPGVATWYWRADDSSAASHAFGLPTDVVSLVESRYYAMRNSQKSGTAGLSGGIDYVGLFVDSTDRLYSVGLGGISNIGVSAGSDSHILRGDYNGDGVADIAVYSGGFWTFYYLSGSFQVIGLNTAAWGTSGDKPVAADFDGDGKADIAIYRPVGALGVGEWWIIRSQNGLPMVFTWGLSIDVPVPADFNGDGWDDAAVWRPADGNWYVLDARSAAPLAVTQWGLPGDAPRVGDFDSDGRIDRAIWRESLGMWFLLYSGGNYGVFQWGLPGDIPVAGHFTSSASSDFGVYRASNKTLYIRSVQGAQYTVSAASVLGAHSGVPVAETPFYPLP
ncbi:MAG: VCBS repeat-containing protein [Deltaproteobacteria bacterium]|nr:VCBS repeat-containing protein [Deltaproteobacteria bacterium]